MAIDRELALKTAERLLRQGKLDGAIGQYVRLVEEQPRDWNSINALGDLYARAGNADSAVAQYVRIADYLFDEGFLPKAAALYKKALKVQSDHDHTLLRLSDIATKQGLLADSKLYLRQLAQQRRARGDERGAVECLVRLAGIDDEDADAKMSGARAAQGIGDTAQAVVLLEDAAAVFERQRRSGDALDALAEAAALAPDDLALRTRVARALVQAGQVERAHELLTVEAAGDDPDLLMLVGRMDLRAGRRTEGISTLMRVLAIAPEQQETIAQLAQELLASGQVDDAFACVEVIVDAALFEAAFGRAADALDTFLERQRFVPALTKLVEVCVDAGFDDRLTRAQADLAEAYLDEGQAAEARVIAEDLLQRAPHVEAYRQCLRRAFDQLGIADTGIGEPEPLFDDSIDLTNLESVDEVEPMEPIALESDDALPAAPAPLDDRPPVDEEEVFDLSSFASPESDDPPDYSSDAFEIDLSDTVAGLHPTPGPQSGSTPGPPDGSQAVAPPRIEAAPEPSLDDPGPPPELDTVFERMRTKAAGAEQTTQAAALFERAQEHLRRGLSAEAATDLQAAARVPQLRFKAAAQLGRLSISRGDLRGGVEWLERAAEAPSPSPDETFSVLYDLADALDRAGESARALAVFIELEADAGSYRDVSDRIESLTRAGASTPANGERG
ncbi:MAG TPA: tetratricopeptide repeat protein [Vicinamibacterales bacterium]|nr:tetratricopeptide repeat protein [Vicinamibacterales bacterium]